MGVGKCGLSQTTRRVNNTLLDLNLVGLLGSACVQTGAKKSEQDVAGGAQVEMIDNKRNIVEHSSTPNQIVVT